jgi:hypothetical protein
VISLVYDVFLCGHYYSFLPFSCDCHPVCSLSCFVRDCVLDLVHGLVCVLALETLVILISCQRVSVHLDSLCVFLFVSLRFYFSLLILVCFLLFFSFSFLCFVLVIAFVLVVLTLSLFLLVRALVLAVATGLTLVLACFLGLRLARVLCLNLFLPSLFVIKLLLLFFSLCVFLASSLFFFCY